MKEYIITVTYDEDKSCIISITATSILEAIEEAIEQVRPLGEIKNATCHL
jgi:nickel-dependent lactate racemase